MDRQATETSKLNQQIFFAARDGDTLSVADLLARGASPNLRELDLGMTPLHLAVHRGDAEMVKLLLTHGAAPSIRDYASVSPLQAAACNGHAAIVVHLVTAGAEVDSRNERGFTPLHDAACEGHAVIVRILLDAGANIDAAAEKKQTPLHMAAYHDRRKVVRVLIERGARLHEKTTEGDTPLFWAASQQHLAVVRLLLDARRGSTIAPAGTQEAPAEAQELCRRAAELRSRSNEDRILAEAEALFREAICRFPGYWAGHFGLGELLDLKADDARIKSGSLMDDIITSLRQAIYLAPDQIEPQLKLARVFAKVDVASAEPLYRAAIDRTNSGSHALYEESFQAVDHWDIGIIAAERGGHDGLALEAFCRAIELDPHFYGGYVMPESEWAQAIWSLALVVKPGKRKKRPSRNPNPLEPSVQRALDEVANKHQEVSLLSGQTVFLSQRYNRTGELSDLEEALEIARRAVRLAPTHPKILANLGYVLLLLYERIGRADDLRASIALYEAALKNSKDDADRLSILNNLSALWHMLYSRTCLREHLERSIEMAREIVDATPGSSPLFPMYLQNVGIKLLDRYKRTGVLEDLQGALQTLDHALSSALPDSPYRPPLLNNLAIALRNRFNHFRDIEDVSRAVDAFEKACAATSQDSPDYLIRLTGLATGLLDRHRATGGVEDLDRAVGMLEVAVGKTDPGSPRFPLRLGNLADALLLRYEVLGYEPDLQSAVAECERLVRITSPESPGFPGYLHQLGSALALRWEHSRFLDDWRQAIDAFQRSTRSGRDTAVQPALIAACRWLSLALRQGEWTEAQSAYGHAWEASEKLVRIQLLRRNKESWLEQTQGLAASAAFAFAKTGRFDEAAEALERGQARLLGEVLAKERTTLERLASSGHADLLERYQDAIGQLHHFSDQEILSEEARARLSQAQTEIGHILETVQGLAGYEGFLQPATIEEIRRAAAIIPLIYIAATPVGGVALVADGSGSNSQPASVSPVWLADLTTDALDTALWGKEARGEEPKGLLSAQRAWQESRELDHFEKWRAAIDRSEHWLWDAVLSPILKAFPTLRTACLIPIGRLSLLPLHTAWHEDSARPTGRTYLLDLLTVSYSPNARTWLEAWRIAERVAPQRLLAIDQPSSAHAAPLPSSEHEVQAVAAQFKESEIIRHQHATRENVLRALPGHDVLHFSCHGRADLANPLLSSLLMAGKDLLTLGDILKLRLDGIRLAVLSACETGVSGIQLPEEVVSLASGLLQAGAGGVISSLAPAPDFSTMLLMSTFYSFWLQGASEPAQALRDAQIWMRDTTNSQKVQAVEDALRGRVRPGNPWWPPETAERIRAELGPRNPQARDYSHPSQWGAFHYVGA
jgi:CHAT domain-containing protein/ankyrin repeat protein